MSSGNKLVVLLVEVAYLCPNYYSDKLEKKNTAIKPLKIREIYTVEVNRLYLPLISQPLKYSVPCKNAHHTAANMAHWLCLMPTESVTKFEENVMFD